MTVPYICLVSVLDSVLLKFAPVHVFLKFAPVYMSPGCPPRSKESIWYCQSWNTPAQISNVYGFERKALSLLRCYLTHRTQRCQLEGMLSDERTVTCGIPQGSIYLVLFFSLSMLMICPIVSSTRHLECLQTIPAWQLHVGETLDEVCIYRRGKTRT